MITCDVMVYMVMRIEVMKVMRTDETMVMRWVEVMIMVDVVVVVVVRHHVFHIRMSVQDRDIGGCDLMVKMVMVMMVQC